MMSLSTPRRAVAVALVTSVAAVPIGGSGGEQKSAVPPRPDDRTILHVLNRLGFGPAPGDVERVRAMGLQAYIEQQLHPERVNDKALDARLAGFETLHKSSRELAQEYFLPAQRARLAERQSQQGVTDAAPARMDAQPEAVRAERQAFAELSEQKIVRAAYSTRQLEEVMVDFWFNHFNVFAGKGPTRLYVLEYEREAIRPHVFGKFRDLLGATAESPAMLFYLDNWQSAAAAGAATSASEGRRRFGPRQRRVPEERSAQMIAAAQNRRSRGLNENYARELMELHTLGVDGGYTQKDVQEVARAFTGWTIEGPRQGGGFRFEPRLHDDGEKIVLGHRIKAGGGRHDGEQVLDILAKHPSTARFVATRLARRFVADAPPQALVERAATRFTQTDGDIREVVRLIVTSPEFFSAAAYRAKVKTPFEFVVSAVRATGADVRAAIPLAQALRDLGMPLYMCQPPTGYADTADAWVNTGALLNRMNFAVALTAGRLRGVGVTLPAGGLDAVRDRFLDDVLDDDVSDATASAAARATEPAQALALVLGSPEFQRR